MGNKYIYEEVKDYFLLYGCELLVLKEEYKNASQKLKYKCRCGGLDLKSFSQFKNSKVKTCSNCRYIISSGKKRKSFSVVKKVFEDNGCKLLTDNFKNNSQLLDYQCKCGRFHSKIFHDFIKSPQCPACSGLERINYSQINDLCLSLGFKLLTLKDEYKNIRTKINFICKCGNERTYIAKNFYHNDKLHKCECECNEKGYKKVKYFIESCGCKLLSVNYINHYSLLAIQCDCGNVFTTSFVNFKHENKRTCDICTKKRTTGENHPRWKGGITSEEEKIRKSPEYTDWRNKIFERDNYTCQCCGNNKGGNLNAHHKENFSSNKELRFDIDNGITLCEDCHNPAIINSFHYVYGTRNNTKEQLEEYIQRYKLGEFIELKAEG